MEKRRSALNRGLSLKMAAVLLLVALAMSCLVPANVDAALADDALEGQTQQVNLTIDDSLLGDSAELEETYLESILYGEVAADSETEAVASDAAEDSTAETDATDYGLSYFADNADAYELYVALKDFVADVAANGGSTVFNYEWTYNGDYSEDATDALQVDEVLACLMRENPYEFYWYDKTAGVTCTYTAALGSGATTFDFTFSFAVSSDYADGGDAYTVSAEGAQAAAAAAEAAQAIVDSCSSCNVMERLEAYKDAICELVSYNEEAASDSSSYGGAWQLIYVFDGDEGTNVVCEGYAKAFQYLCDLTWPDSDEVACYTVTGTMVGATGAGGHMWNIVVVDGESYLVDVTDSDEGTIGEYGELFLASLATASETAAEGYDYTFSISEKTIEGENTITTISGGEVSYAYDEETLQLYGSDESAEGEGSASGDSAETSILELSSEEFPSELVVHDLTAVEAVEATCVAAGNSAYWCCENCGACFADESAATETTLEAVTIAATGEHSYVSEVSVEASCGTTGIMTYTCSVCGDSYAEEIAATGEHSWDEGVVTLEASCTEAGSITYTCTVCGATTTEEIAASGHSLVEVAAVEATCAAEGHSAYYECTVCGALFADAEGTTETTLEAVAIAATGEHAYDEGVVTTEASCGTAGVMTYTCTVCGATTTEEIAATGEHTWGEGEVVESTDAGHGTVSFTCTVCGGTKTEGFSYDLVEGEGQTIASGDVLTVTASGEAEALVAVQIDGVALDASSYTVESGSTVVTVGADYLASLDAGEHTLTFVYEYGSVDATFTVEAVAEEEAEESADADAAEEDSAEDAANEDAAEDDAASDDAEADDATSEEAESGTEEETISDEASESSEDADATIAATESDADATAEDATEAEADADADSDDSDEALTNAGDSTPYLALAVLAAAVVALVIAAIALRHGSKKDER